MQAECGQAGVSVGQTHDRLAPRVSAQASKCREGPSTCTITNVLVLTTAPLLEPEPSHSSWKRQEVLLCSKGQHRWAAASAGLTPTGLWWCGCLGFEEGEDCNTFNQQSLGKVPAGSVRLDRSDQTEYHTGPASNHWAVVTMRNHAHAHTAPAARRAAPTAASLLTPWVSATWPRPAATCPCSPCPPARPHRSPLHSGPHCTQTPPGPRWPPCHPQHSPPP